jgi:uncharacterized protein (TIGR02996 family)
MLTAHEQAQSNLFRQAIAQHYSDSFYYLIYADWLEEQGLVKASNYYSKIGRILEEGPRYRHKEKSLQRWIIVVDKEDIVWYYSGYHYRKLHNWKLLREWRSNQEIAEDYIKSNVWEYC